MVLYYIDRENNGKYDLSAVNTDNIFFFFHILGLSTFNVLDGDAAN